jgi:cardiolipin synthase A/B
MDLTSPATWGWLYVISEWAIRIGMLLVVPFRRSPEAAKGWLLLTFFLPWAGLILYWVIGRPKYPVWRAKRFHKLPAMYQAVRERLEAKLTPFHPEEPPFVATASALVQNLGHFGLLGGNAVELLADYDGSIDRLVADIDGATHHVHLLYYIFADDETGLRVVAALERAVQRGVICRVLVDYLGGRRWAKGLGKAMQRAGVDFHRVLPVHFFRRKSARADLRNHRKIAVIDGRTAYIGSQNLLNSTFKPGMVYEELVARMTGPVALQLQGTFVADWYLETEEALNAPEWFPEPVAAGNVAAQVLPSGPDFAATNVQQFIVALMYAARQRIVITTPYFIPDAAILQALETAVRRGVAVHLVVSRIADQFLVSMAQRSYYAQLLEAGVHVHLYHERFLHAKHMSVDDAVSVIGSSNMDIRSFVLNAEVSLIVYDTEVSLQLRRQQERYFSGSEKLLLHTWRQRSQVAKFSENMARLMSPLL